MSDRPGYVTVQTTILPDPIEVPLDEVEVLRSQGLLVTTPPAPPPVEATSEPEPPAAPVPAPTPSRKAKPS